MVDYTRSRCIEVEREEEGKVELERYQNGKNWSVHKWHLEHDTAKIKSFDYEKALRIVPDATARKQLEATFNGDVSTVVMNIKELALWNKITLFYYLFAIMCTCRSELCKNLPGSWCWEETTQIIYVLKLCALLPTHQSSAWYPPLHALATL